MTRNTSRSQPPAGAAASHQFAPHMFDLTADPIFAALDAWRSAKAERAAAQKVVDWDSSPEEDGDGRRRPEWTRYDHAIDREFEAKYAVCNVTPTTAAGAAAFVRFLTGEMIFEEVEFGYHGAEDATRQALSNLDHLLTRLAAGAV